MGKIKYNQIGENMGLFNRTKKEEEKIEMTPSEYINDTITEGMSKKAIIGRELLKKDIEEKGFYCNIEMPIFITKKVDPLARTGATLLFGLAGYALTSRESKAPFFVTDYLQIVEPGIIIKNSTEDKKNFRIKWDEILNVEYLDNPDGRIKIELIDGSKIKFYPTRNQLQDEKTSKKYKISYPPESIEKLFEKIDSFKKGSANHWEDSDSKSDNSIADEIAKFHNLKEKGIITEDEFKAKKKELL